MDSTTGVQKRRKQGFPRLVQIAGRRRWLMILSMILAVLGSFAEFIPMISIYKILVELAKHAGDPTLMDTGVVMYWAMVALWSFVVQIVVMFGGVMLSHISAFSILYELRMMLARKLVRLPMGYFTRQASGSIKKVINEDVERLELFIAHHLGDIVSSLAFPLCLFGYMFVVDWRLAAILVVLLGVLTGIIMQAMGRKAMRRVMERFLDAQAKLNGSIVEYLRGIQVVKTFTDSTNAYRQLNDDIAHYHKVTVEHGAEFRSTYVGFQTILSAVMLVLIPPMMYLLRNAPVYANYVPVVLMFLLFSVGAFFPIIKFLWVGSFLRSNLIGVERVDAILDAAELPEPATPAGVGDGGIEFDHVHFAYDDKPVLRDVSFRAKPGSITALVGPSGSGKSTIAMLAARFWDVQSGEIRIGGRAIQEIGTEALMSHVAFVFQDNMLFFDTIEENIRMGNQTASFEEVVEAAKRAQCHEFIEALPNGYKTLVGEGGTYLSGGEQQRIAIARAALKDAPIILLDEATAFADPENEGKILAGFSEILRGKTVLVIAHRLGTIVNANQILYIEHGEIAEHGTHPELLELGGKYKQMWELYERSRRWQLGA